MLSKVLLSLVPAASAAASGAAALQHRADGGCTDVHIFLSRGNNEPYPGRQGKLVEAICSKLTQSCDYENIIFDNALSVEYCTAVTAGVVAAKAQISAYAERCPNSKLVVSGYSQGASVVGDLMAGAGGVFFHDCVQPSSTPFDRSTSPGKNIAAALVFGDTRHTADQSYNVLSGAGDNGLFPRPPEQLAAMNQYANVLHSYCVSTDPICAKGDVVETHLNYFNIYSDMAADWVKSMVDTTPSSSSSTQSSTTSAPSSSSTSSAAPSTISSSTSSSILSSSAIIRNSTTSAESTSAPATKSAPASVSTGGSSAGKTSSVASNPAPGKTTSGSATTPTNTTVTNAAGSLTLQSSLLVLAGAAVMYPLL